MRANLFVNPLLNSFFIIIDPQIFREIYNINYRSVLRQRPTTYKAVNTEWNRSSDFTTLKLT